jgi:hypothetical protein
MGQIAIRCPNKGEMITTGMTMDRGSFESSTISDNSVQCPACGETHTWSKEDATLTDD